MPAHRSALCSLLAGAQLRLSVRVLASVLILVCTAGLAQTPAQLPPLNDAQALALGHRIWGNESNASFDGLTAWNRGEEFASLGIGHFIWYPPGVEKTFSESFPALLDYLRSLPTLHDPSAQLPAWLMPAGLACPWLSREQFLVEFDTPRLVELRQFLAATIAEQSRFIARRLGRALPAILAQAGPATGAVLRERFLRLYASAEGLYALIDYVNFKGEGTALSERYQGVGWGLAQVLEGMTGAPDRHPADDFADAAAAALERRIELSPPSRGEKRWRAGWLKRVESYRPER